MEDENKEHDGQFDANGVALSDAAIADKLDLSPRLDAAHERIDRLETRLALYGVALARILTHLDPSHTSHTLDMEDLI